MMMYRFIDYNINLLNTFKMDDPFDWGGGGMIGIGNKFFVCNTILFGILLLFVIFSS